MNSPTDPSRTVPFERHAIQWTSEKVSRFWAWFATTHTDDKYFARTYGADLLRHIRPHGVLKGRALDFGCGPGFLLDHLLAFGMEVTGADLSHESLDRVRARLGNRVRVVHASELAQERSGFDVAFLLETVEHLDDTQLNQILEEVSRLVRPGGSVVITTPNEERLADKTVMCPDCGCEFHRVQHVRSFSESSLGDAVRRAGLTVAWSTTTTLGGSRISSARDALHRKLRGKKGTNLLMIARRA